MEFTGTEPFNQDVDTLLAKLTDTGFVSQVVPDLDRVERLEPRAFVCRVRPKLAFLTGTLRLAFSLVDTDQPNQLRVQVTGKGIGAKMKVEADLNVTANGSGSQLAWTGRILERQGLLKPIGESLLQGAATRVICDFWSNFRTALDATDA